MPLPEKARLPFDSYDFFGYLIPGFFFFLSLLTFEYLGLRSDVDKRFVLGTESHCPPLLTLVLPLSKAEPSWEIELLILAAALVTFYIAGHVIAAFSSIGIERLFVQKVYGFPHETLLRRQESQASFSITRIKLNKVTYIFFLQCTNIALILFTFGLCFEQPMICNIAVLLLLFTLTVCAIAFGYYCKVLRTQWDAKLGPFMRFIRLIMACVGAPYLFVTYLISIFIRSREGFDNEFREEFHRLYREEFLKTNKLSDNNMFWFSYMFVAENTSRLGPMIANWLHLYGFSRNLSTSCYLSFICMLFYICYYQVKSQMLMVSSMALVIMTMVLVLSCIMAIRYYYLYNGYYSKFTFRAFVYAARHPISSRSPRHGTANEPTISPANKSDSPSAKNSSAPD